MGTIEVIEAGMQSSVQDLGRAGYRHAGVPQSGAFDSVALRVCNRLLGNDEADAGVEMTIVGGAYRFSVASVVCLDGAEASGATVEHGGRRARILHKTPTVIPAGATLRVGRFSGGARGYLCVRGGIQSRTVLGSRSAFVSLPDAGLGRALQSGDRLTISELAEEELVGSGAAVLAGSSRALGAAPHLLRIVPGAHTDHFCASQQADLGEHGFRVSSQSNRAGVRLERGKLSGEMPSRVSSEGTMPGYVQLPAAGDPIVLGVDGPTTGGYPVIACVIKADLPVLGQCAPGDQVCFRWMSREAALEALSDQEAMILSVQARSAARLDWGHRND